MAEGKGRRNGNGNGNGRRRIWEFQSFTICRLLGLSLNEKGLKRIFKDLKLKHGNLLSAEFEMHQELVQICQTQNQHAKRVEKILEKQFAPYKKRAGISDPEKICEFLEGKEGAESILKDVPLSALIWFAARNGNRGENKGKAIEKRIFTAVHMKEHQALRFCDDLSRKLPGGKAAEDVVDELRTALESNERLLRNCKRLDQKKEELISEREAIKADKIQLVQELEAQKRLNERLRKKIEELGGEAAFEQIEAMKAEMELLREEIKRLNKENTELIKMSATAASNFNFTRRKGMKMAEATGDNLAASACNCNDNSELGKGMKIGPLLKGVRVAYVGGVESLESCYKEMAESFGCLFCYHCGHCERGKRAIESLVEKNDVIFCPVDINSHNACRMIKEACKQRSKPYYFLRSSGLSALKKGLVNFASQVCI
ncbi:DUF2325 domain-containing protein [Methanophagales archaeon]|nr:MAG: DUF2325 domain-containing protein [Methanophagales archaeon]